MPTISTLWVVMVLGSVIAPLVFVMVLAFMASRLNQSLRIDLHARLFRIKVAIHNEQSRSETRPTAPNDDPGSSRTGEKTS
jgi:hypothetical protein